METSDPQWSCPSRHMYTHGHWRWPRTWPQWKGQGPTCDITHWAPSVPTLSHRYYFAWDVLGPMPCTYILRVFPNRVFFPFHFFLSTLSLGAYVLARELPHIEHPCIFPVAAFTHSVFLFFNGMGMLLCFNSPTTSPVSPSLETFRLFLPYLVNYSFISLSPNTWGGVGTPVFYIVLCHQGKYGRGMVTAQQHMDGPKRGTPTWLQM